MPDFIEVRGARVHNLKNLTLQVPLRRIVGIAGVSGSGKSSLALGVLYAEGSRRYLESLSTYTRRRMSYAGPAAVDEILHVPPALALRQRPGIPGLRSTFGTGTELLNYLRLMFSRLSSHRCPHGHYVPPSLKVAAEQPLICPECGVEFYPPSAEELAFNSQGACPHCAGTGTVRTVNRASLVPDENLSIDEGAVAPWNTLMWSLMTDVCRAMGVRTNVPFKDLTDKEKDIVYDGPAVKKHILYQPKNGAPASELDFTYYSAVHTVENALSKVKDEKGMKRVERFLKTEPCPHCGGTRLNERARAPLLHGMNLAQACTLTLTQLCAWVEQIPGTLPEDMRPMAQQLTDAFAHCAQRLKDLGLSYLTLDRAAATLSTGERQRMQLARAVRSRSCGALYVLDEPSIGLHPVNLQGLITLMQDLKEDGNTVILVDHDPQILQAAEYLIELGPGSGSKGGSLVAAGTVEEVRRQPQSKIAPFLTGKPQPPLRRRCEKSALFKYGRLVLNTNALHTVQPLQLILPKGRLTAVTGVSGSGKTTLILECLVPALQALAAGEPLPQQIKSIEPGGINTVKLIDAAPIGLNVRSTVGTYCGVHDDLRKVFAQTAAAKAAGFKAGDFSYNTGRLRCPECDGTGSITLDVQFLPDVEILCPHCRGARYDHAARDLRWVNKNGESFSLPGLMALEVSTALKVCAELKPVASKLQVLQDLGLGYLTLGEATPGLSGGEAQRLKLAAELTRAQDGTLFVFDEPTIGLHPLDVRTLIGVLQSLIDKGASVVVIEHDLELIRQADYMVDLGPGGGCEGGRIVAQGTLEDIIKCPDSLTASFL